MRKLLFIALASLSLTSSVRADGEQLMPGSAQSVARGGATAARPTNVAAMLQNPAGLVDLEGDQGLYNFDQPIDTRCVHPYGYYGWGVYLPEERDGSTSDPAAHRSEFGDPASKAYGTRHLDTVCNSSPTIPLPQIAFALHLTDRLSVGFALLMAQVFVGGANYGGLDGTISAGGAARPTPTRYDLINQDVGFGMAPAASIAYRVMPWLSLGATLQVTGASVDSYAIMALRAGTSPANDMLAKLHVADYFMPSLILSAYAKPTERLRFAAVFNWSDKFDGGGDLTFTTNYYHQGAVGHEGVPLRNDPIKLRTVQVDQPWSLTLAGRYVKPRLGAPNSKDPLVIEDWDVELDASYTANHSVKANRVEIASDFGLEFRRADGTPQMPLNVTQKDLDTATTPRNLLDLFVLRLGGSYNALPGRLQVSAGGFFQTRSTRAAYASMTNFGFERLGLGCGLLVRLGSVDLMAAYAHIFQEEMDIAPPPHQPRNEATSDPRSGFDQRVYEDGQLSQQPKVDSAAPSPSKADAVAAAQQPAVLASTGLRPRVVNAGRYVASFDVISIGLVHHF